jgi:hypothetical protein
LKLSNKKYTFVLVPSEVQESPAFAKPCSCSLGTILSNSVLNGQNTESPKIQVADTEKPIE